jgi:rod shape determining protein RodA
LRAIYFDWPLFALGLALSGCGLVLVYSATWVAREPPGPFFSEIFLKQALALGMAMLLYYFLRRLKWGIRPETWLWWYIPAMLLLLLVVLIGHGEESHGSQRWINLGIVKLQPSELAKAAWVLILAWYYSLEQSQLTRSYLRLMLVMGSMVLLIMRQPDLGTSLAFIFSFFVVSALAQVPRRLILLTALGLLLLAVPGWFLMHDYQQNRVLAFFGKELNTGEDANPRYGRLRPASPGGANYQINQSLIAVGSGGLAGKGFLHGTQVRGGFIPVVESDFIFALIGEEFGFIGALVILLLYMLLLARILALAQQAHTPYERLVCYGISAIFLFHVLVGIGMTIRLTPVAGVPLPFISQGGSSLITFWLLLAILESIYEGSRHGFTRDSARRRA